MERKISFRNSRGERLAGVLHVPRQNAYRAIVISHGFASTKDRPRLVKLARALCRNGFAVLRFDFGGCGESEEREIMVRYQVDDLKSAVKHLRKQYAEIGLVGESLGGLTSILAFDSRIKTLVLLAPVTKAKEPEIFGTGGLKEEMDENGFAIYRRDGREFRIPKEYAEERRTVNQKEILSKVKCPVLIIHGNKDERIPLGHSRQALKLLPKGSKLEVIAGGDHPLNGKIEEVIPLAVAWCKKRMRAN